MSQGFQRQKQPQALSRPIQPAADVEVRSGASNELEQPAQVEPQAGSFFDRLLVRLNRLGKTQTASHDKSWHNIIWREWRHTADEEYAQHLFALVGEKPVSAEIVTLIRGLLGLVYGGMFGLLLTLIAALGDPITMSWALGMSITGAVLGGAGGCLIGLLRGQGLSWQAWLAQLTFNLNPTELALLGGVTLAGIITWFFSLLAGFGHVASIIIVGILLLEGLGARVMVWLLGLDQGIKPDYSHRFRAGWFWWRDRPYRTEFETALRKACAVSSGAAETWGPILENLEQQRKHPGAPEQLVDNLRHADWVERFTAAQLLITLGGVAVPPLQEAASQRASILRRKAIDLLRQIERETTQLADRCWNLLCPRCLRRCGQHSVTVAGDMTIIYYGCRMCGQSHVLWPGKVVAVLDADMPGNVERTDPFRVNWLTRHFLFDFDEVEIIKATDEEAERFVVQVGNDTDPVRTGRYQHMPCRIGPDCHLSDNTIRVLGSVFGTVVQM